MKKKIVLIIIIVISIILIGAGLIFAFVVGDNSNFGNNSNNGNIIDVNAELEKDENIHMENVYKFNTLDDAINYLKSVSETENVLISENDGFEVKIKVFSGTDDEIIYKYLINGGDLTVVN